jgi:metallophosphoesterase (TIGR03767 family)
VAGSRRTVLRTLAIALPLTLAAGVLLGVAEGAPEDCGPTTLDGTIMADEDGILVCAEGEPVVIREEFSTAREGRSATRTPLIAFFSLADFQLADEESPLRGEWADKCGDLPSSGAFRPQETMVPHLLNAHVLAANRIALSGSPILGRPFDFTIALGDLADNQHHNETRLFIDLLDGRKLVDPDSGADGYDGVQAADPGGGDPPLESPVTDVSILDLANEPFIAAGLRGPDGAPLPWYSVMGNHDMKVQGTVSDDNPAWREFVRRWAVGPVKVMDVAPDRQQQACDAFTDPEKFQEFLLDVASDPTAGTTRVVPADPDRRLLDKADWIAEHFDTSGIPAGHGFAPQTQRCPNVDFPDYAPRACYSFLHGKFHFIVLDTTAAEGLESGNIDDDQFEWLRQQLESSSRSYFDEEGNPVSNPEAINRLIVIVSHHTISSTENSGPRTGQEPGTVGTIHTGEDLQELLLRFPNVILHNAGHTHQNMIWARENPDLSTAYWEVNTAAIVDWPIQSRTIEIADNGDGSISIFAVVFDAAAGPNPREIDWDLDDPTDELAMAQSQTALTLKALGDPERNVNEDWLAAAGREVGYHDPQNDLARAGEPENRNVELLLGAPFDLSAGEPIGTAETGRGWGSTALGAGLMIAAGALAFWARGRASRPASSTGSV